MFIAKHNYRVLVSLMFMLIISRKYERMDKLKNIVIHECRQAVDNELKNL